MRILIHALGANKGGAMRHLTNFLPALRKYDSQRDYIVLVRDSVPLFKTSENIHIERVSGTEQTYWAKRLIYDIYWLPQRLKREKFSAVVSLTNFGPIWSSVPHIFFQRNPIYYCSHYLQKITGRLKLETLLRRKLAVASMKRSDVVVTPSHSMAEMIRQKCPQVKDRLFRTLYHGFSRESSLSPLEPRYKKLLTRAGIKLLYPTHPAPHKGFHILFDMLAQFKKVRSDFTLFTPISYDEWPEVVGEYERQIQTLELQNHVVFMGNIPQRQMGALYQQCDLMVYPSLCESFGFSMIEAMGYGLPIVAAGTDINREMCGEGALYYDALNPSDGAKMILKALESGESKKLLEGGQKRINSFDWSWQRYAREFVNIIESVV